MTGRAASSSGTIRRCVMARLTELPGNRLPPVVIDVL
jgi:hypothetical protein